MEELAKGRKEVRRKEGAKRKKSDKGDDLLLLFRFQQTPGEEGVLLVKRIMRQERHCSDIL